MSRPAEERLPGLALALALPTVALAVLLPPELSGAGRFAWGMSAAAAALLFAWREPLAAPGRGLAPALLLPVALAGLVAAPCRARAVDEAAQFAALILVGLLGVQAARDSRSWRLVALLLVALATGAAIQAIVQSYWLYPREAELLRAAGAAAADNMILRLEAGRPAGPFILPAALAGFLALALPGTLYLARSAAWRGSRALLIAAAVLVLHAIVLTRSLGGVAAAAAGLVVLLPAMTPRRRAVGGLLIALLAFLLAGWFLHLRRAEIDRGPGGDPLHLRAGNWRAAVQMIGDRPLLGVGPGSFGTAYPRYMREGMNETRYAHNSYLQAAACWGIWILGPIAALLVGFFRRIGAHALAGAPSVEEGARLALSAGAATFLLHNLVDFTLYLPGIAVPAALLLGMTLGDGGTPLQATNRWRPASRLVAIAAAVLIAWNAVLVYRVEAHMQEARRAAEAGDVRGAASAARRAAAVRPGSPEPWAFLAELVLAHHMGDEIRRGEGVEASARAVRLDPESAILHHTRALYHAAAGERAPAYLEQRRANRLYPLKSDYRVPEAVEETP